MYNCVLVAGLKTLCFEFWNFIKSLDAYLHTCDWKKWLKKTKFEIKMFCALLHIHKQKKKSLVSYITKKSIYRFK